MEVCANFDSFTITDSKNRWSFGLQPITFKIANSKDESNYGTVNGFLPDINVVDNVLPYKAFGDPTETFLSKALNYISPVAYKATSLSNSFLSKATMVNPLPMSDNRRMDRKEMWIDQNQ